MICPVCHNKVKMTTKTSRDLQRILMPHPHSEAVLYCPGSNRTAKEAQEIAKSEKEIQ